MEDEVPDDGRGIGEAEWLGAPPEWDGRVPWEGGRQPIGIVQPGDRPQNNWQMIEALEAEYELEIYDLQTEGQWRFQAKNGNYETVCEVREEEWLDGIRELRRVLCQLDNGIDYPPPPDRR